jgi:hypothetical protein
MATRGSRERAWAAHSFAANGSSARDLLEWVMSGVPVAWQAQLATPADRYCV